MRNKLLRLLELISEGGNEDEIRLLEHIIADSINETAKEDTFYKLGTRKF